MNNIVNQIPFLRTSRQFPEQAHQLSVEINRSYLEIAAAVNNRTIGLFSVNRPAITGDSYFVNSSRQRTLRQIYVFTTTTAIPHNLDKVYLSIPYFTRLYGQYTDGTNWYGLIAGSNVAIAGQISFYVDPVNINFLVGAGAPALTNFSGIITLEWMSQI